MQNPLARSGMAWWSPPQMLALCRLSPLHTWRAASAVAPTTWAAARCMSSKTGLSSLPSPYAGSKPTGSFPARFTASINPASWTVAIRSSSATGALTVRRRSSTPRSPARRRVRSTRIGDMGWLGPKSYSVSVGSNTTEAGPEHARMRVTLPVSSTRAPSLEPLLVARLTADPRSSTPSHHPAAHGRSFCISGHPWASTSFDAQEPTMDRNLSLITPTGRLTLGNHVGALRRFVEAQDVAPAGECFFGLSDLHALTTPQDPTVLRATIA